MYVGRLLVKGYRSLRDVSISFYPGLNVLVGKNNAGKSNVIKALDIVLGERWPTYANIEDRDFYRPSSEAEPTDTFLIAVRLDGESFNRELIVSENVRAQVFELGDGPIWNNLDELESEPESRGTWRSGEELANLVEQANSVWFYVVVPRGSQRKERTFAAYLKHRTGRWYQLRKFGGEFRDALLTTAHVPSFRDPERQLRITHYTWYGKLIRSLYETKSDDQTRRIQGAQQELTATVGEVFEHATVGLRKRLAPVIFHHEISFKPGAYTRDDAHKQIAIFVDDGLDTPYYEKGSGIQSALVIALFGYYCDHFHQGGSLLLAEEPEIYLHPQARRAIEAQLVGFAKEGMPTDADDPQRMCTRQVIISTHAAEFLRSVDLRSITCVRKPPDQTATSVIQINPSRDDATLRRWRQMIRTKNAEMFFADHVILVEGGEEYLLPVLADLRFGESRWLDSHNVSVVRADGKSQFAAYSAILSELGIGHSILTDLDFLRSGIDDFLYRFDNGFKDRLNDIRILLQVNPPTPRGRDVKGAFAPDTRDWVALYYRVEHAVRDLCENHPIEPSRVTQIQRLWNQLRDRVVKPNLREVLGDDETLISLLEAARRQSIFILSQGELEDYLTEEALALEDSKDRRALALAERLVECRDLHEARRWIHYDEFIVVLEAVAQALGVGVQHPQEGQEPGAYDQDVGSGFLDEEIPF